VLRAVALLRQERYRPLFAGLLATIDIRSDPVAVYRALAELDPAGTAATCMSSPSPMVRSSPAPLVGR
jgi:hypothetical protein